MKVPDVLKSRKDIYFGYNEDGVLLKQVEEFWEVEQPEKPGEFAGDDLTQSLDHGDVPLEAGGWRIHKVYEKKVIWIRRGEETKA